MNADVQNPPAPTSASDPIASSSASADPTLAIDVLDLTRSFRKRKGWLRSGDLIEAVVNGAIAMERAVRQVGSLEIA